MDLTRLETLGMGTQTESDGCLIQLGFQVADGRQVLVFTTEKFDDFDRRTKVGERIDFQNIQRLDTAQTAVSIFIQQCLQHRPRLLAILREYVALLYSF